VVVVGSLELDVELELLGLEPDPELFDCFAFLRVLVPDDDDDVGAHVFCKALLLFPLTVPQGSAPLCA
jgi:hypothetical protein